MSLKVGIFHPGTQHSLQTALAFQEAGQLRWHATPIYYTPSRFPYSLEKLMPPALANRLRQQIQRRHLPELDSRLIREGELHAWAEVAARAVGLTNIARQQSRLSLSQFSARVVRLIEREPVDLIWGFDGSALKVFRWAKSRGILCILDRTTIDAKLQNQIISEEQVRNPEYFTEAWRPKSSKTLAAEEEEIALADKVVVGSVSCAESLVANGCPAEKVCVVAYGFNETQFPQEFPVHARTSARPLNFIYVGRISPLKGAVYLLNAFAKLPPQRAKLTLLGSLRIPPALFSKFSERVTYVPTVPWHGVPEYMSGADCLIFPSLLEGSSLVLKEAYGAGIGCIQTPISGDGIMPGRNGAFIEASSSDAIVAAVTSLIERPEAIEAWRVETWENRSERTWSSYRRRVRAQFSATVA